MQRINVCRHNLLARSCETCLLEEEVKRLKNLIGGVVESLTTWAINLENVRFSSEEYQALQQITKPLFEEDMTT